MASSRAARLAAIKAELMADHGYTADNISRTDRERIEHAALLKLQHEIVSGKLVEGGSVGTDELVKLTEAINAMLPTKQPKPVVVEYVDSFDIKLEALLKTLAPELVKDALVAELSQRITGLETENDVLKAEIQRLRRYAESRSDKQSDSSDNVTASEPKAVPPPPLSVVKPKQSDGHFMQFALENMRAERNPAAASGPEYNTGPAWRFDEQGRRLDEHGLHADRKKT
jgi:hypothetical protein